LISAWASPLFARSQRRQAPPEAGCHLRQRASPGPLLIFIELAQMVTAPLNRGWPQIMAR
jgi:hypothetical protein